MVQTPHTLLPFLRQLEEQYLRNPPSGAKIVGYLCLSSPVELLDAVGAIPIRLMPGSSDAELRGGRFLSSDSCSFCKAILGGLDRGDMQPDAILGSTTCDQMRRNLEIIQRDLKIKTFIFNSPRTADNPFSREFARDELHRLAMEISAWAGIEISSDKLFDAIARRRNLRQRLANLVGAHPEGGLRSSNAPTSVSPFFKGGLRGIIEISGAEFFALMQLYQTTSLDFFEEHLPEIESRLAKRPSPFQKPPLRMALLGSCIGEGDDQVINLIEEGGRATVIYDSICTGRRALREFAGGLPLSPFFKGGSRGIINPPSPPLGKGDDQTGDPFEILTSLYHDPILCPHLLPNERLFEVAAEEIRALGVQGVIYKTLKFCHPWGFEARRFKETLGLPFLHLDHDLSNSAIGQMRTRIAAFIEQLTIGPKR